MLKQKCELPGPEGLMWVETVMRLKSAWVDRNLYRKLKQHGNVRFIVKDKSIAYLDDFKALKRILKENETK